MHGLQTPKRSFCLRFLSGWRDGCFSPEMPERCLLFGLFFCCQALLCLHTARGVWCTQIQPTGALLSRQALQAASPGLQTIPNCPYFMKYMDEKSEVWLFSSASTSWSSLSIALNWPMVKSAPRMSPWVRIWRVSRACVRLLLHFQMSSLLIQPSPKSREHQAKQTQLCKTNLVPKVSTDTPSFPGKENHCSRCLPSLRAAGLGLLCSFLPFGGLCCNLYLNTEDRKEVCFVCLFGVFFLFLWLLKDRRVYCVWNAGRV